MRVLGSAPSGKLLFPSVRFLDIHLLCRLASFQDPGFITWHGFRRGRAEDLVRENPSNPSLSIKEVAEHLGHNLRRAAFFHYLRPETSDRTTVVRQLGADTDSE